MKSWPAASVPALPHEHTGPPQHLFDSATGTIRPLEAGPVVTLYVCGITPYDATHLGHALTYLTYDLLVRTLRDAGHIVRYTQNVTDVDDPLLERARATGEDWTALAERETQLFREDMTALRVLPPDHYIGAVEAMSWVTGFIDDLSAREAAYRVDEDVYFPIAVSKRFGAISHLNRSDMLTIAAERGGDPGRAGKRDPLDPMLWLAQRPGEPSWDSPWGPGRPGWHVECAAIARETLGPTIDIQGGGLDLLFPHHELSAAHSEVASGETPAARFFTHVAMLSMDGHKMSKSLGNLVFVNRLRTAGVDPGAIRLALAGNHYRQGWEWTPAALDDAQQRLARWREATAASSGAPAEQTLQAVRTALAADLDTPSALLAVDSWCSAGGRDPDAPRLVRELVDALLGIAL